MSSHPIAIEPDEIDDLPAYQPSSSTFIPLPSNSTTPQPEVYGRMSAIAGEVASDRRYTGGDILDEPVPTTLVTPPPNNPLFLCVVLTLLGSYETQGR